MWCTTYGSVTIPEELDETDRKIIYHVCSGTHSYSELADLAGVSRNTVYRRINKLEENGMIKKRVMAVPDFESIGFSSIIIGINVGLGDMERTVRFLKRQKRIKFLWKTYGKYEVVALLMCKKDDVGNCINNLKGFLEELDVDIKEFDASPSMSWEKVDFTPFEVENTEKEDEENQAENQV